MSFVINKKNSLPFHDESLILSYGEKVNCFILALMGLLLTYSTMFLVQYKYGFMIVIAYLIIMYYYNKLLVCFIIFTSVIFSHFIFNPGTMTIDFFLINNFRINDYAWAKGIIRFSGYIVPFLLLYSISNSFLSRNTFSILVKRKILPLLGVLWILFFLSLIISGGSVRLLYQSILDYSMFFLTIIAIDGISLTRSQIKNMLKFVYYCIVPLQIIIVTIGILNIDLFFQSQHFGDLVVGTTQLSSMFFTFIMLGVFYNSFPLFSPNHKWKINEKLSTLFLVFFLLLAQSGLQLVILIVIFLVGNVLAYFIKFRIKKIVQVIFATSIVIVTLSYSMRLPVIADNLDYFFRTIPRYYNLGIKNNPKFVGYNLIKESTNNNITEFIFGKGPGEINDQLVTRSQQYAKEKLIGLGQASTNQTTFYILLGNFGLFSTVIFYCLVFIVLMKLLRIFKETNNKICFASIAIIVFLLIQSFLLHSIEKMTIAFPIGVFIGLVLKLYIIDQQRQVTAKGNIL